MSNRFRLAGLNALLAFMIAFAGFAGMAQTTSAQAVEGLEITITSADPGTANEMAADSTWEVTSAAGSVGDTFAAGDLQLPATITVNNPVPYGEYEVTINAGPAFEVFTGTFDINVDTTSIPITLTPADDSGDPDPEPVRTLVHVTPVGVAGTFSGTCAGEAVSGTFGTDGWGDIGEFLVGVECDLTLAAEGYANGAAVGTTFANFDYAMIEGSLGDPIEDPDPEVPATTVGVALADGGTATDVELFWAVDDPSQSPGNERLYEGTHTYDLPATLFVDDLDPGEYWIVIDGLPNYYPIQARFIVTEEGPNTFIYELEAVEDPENGLVEIHKVYCEGTDEVTFMDDLSGIHEGCESGPAVFTFYLYGDGTDEHWQIEIDESGQGQIELAAGTYEVIEEGTQARADIEVVAGDTTVMAVLNPVGETPDNGDADNGKDEDKKDDEKESEVKDLPKTGTGHEAGSMQAATMLAAAAAVAATAGGFVLRQKRG